MGRMDRAYDTLWLPKSCQDLEMLPPTSIVYKSPYGGITVVQTAPQVVIKYGGVFSEEIICARYARRKTSSPVPRIIHHPQYSSLGAWFICTTTSFSRHTWPRTMHPRVSERVSRSLPRDVDIIFARKQVHRTPTLPKPTKRRHTIHAWRSISPRISLRKDLALRAS